MKLISRHALALCATGLASFTGLPAVASETTETTGHAETEHAEHHRNKIELGIANTHTEHGENAFTLAASYGYRFSDFASIGLLGEYAFDPLDIWVVGIPLKLYPGHGWVLTAMPGAEIHNGHEEALFRLGVGYEFEIEGGYSITPEFNVDYVDDEVEYVVGLTFGFGF